MKFNIVEGLSSLKNVVDLNNSVAFIDENVLEYHSEELTKYFEVSRIISIRHGENSKSQETVNSLINLLLELGADRSTTLVGIGGGVVTDLTGYVASIYMRGINFGFVPTTILGMVDASIGGKNGINYKEYKNILGIIRQPSFIIYDDFFLDTLPNIEWRNGFAEIIKHACVLDEKLFRKLEKNSILEYKNNKKKLKRLIFRNINIKKNIVKKDENEKGIRRLLNFGHTLGHALEKTHDIKHGFAISIGMIYAAMLSEEFTNFSETERLSKLLKQYGLPNLCSFNENLALEMIENDKKKTANWINLIVLNSIGNGAIHQLDLNDLKNAIKQIKNKY